MSDLLKKSWRSIYRSRNTNVYVSMMLLKHGSRNDDQRLCELSTEKKVLAQTSYLFHSTAGKFITCFALVAET